VWRNFNTEDSNLDCYNHRFIKEELTETMQGFKNKTTVVTDGVDIELFKYAFQKVLKCFTDLANTYWRYKCVQKERNVVLIAPI
jgi:hypothetical protein